MHSTQIGAHEFGHGGSASGLERSGGERGEG